MRLIGSCWSNNSLRGTNYWHFPYLITNVFGWSENKFNRKSGPKYEIAEGFDGITQASYSTWRRDNIYESNLGKILSFEAWEEPEFYKKSCCTKYIWKSTPNAWLMTDGPLPGAQLISLHNTLRPDVPTNHLIINTTKYSTIKIK